jgi:hypothetical protein
MIVRPERARDVSAIRAVHDAAVAGGQYRRPLVLVNFMSLAAFVGAGKGMPFSGDGDGVFKVTRVRDRQPQMFMAQSLRLIFCFLLVSAAGCGTSPSVSGRADADLPTLEPADAPPEYVMRLGPESEREALRIAEAYLREVHPHINLTKRLPTAAYFESAAPTHGRRLWVVTFSAFTPMAVAGVRPFYTQDVWVRGDGKATLGPAHTPRE